MMKIRKTLLHSLVGALLLASAAPVLAATGTVNVDAAKKEGTVVWYSSTPIQVAQKISIAFQNKYGIKVQLYRSGGSAILSRFMQERAGKHVGADVMTASDPIAYQTLAKEGAFVAFNPKGYEHIPKSLRSPDGYYVAQRLNVISLYGRTDLIAPKDFPKSWTDLLDPKYKGKLVMPDPSYSAITLFAVASMVKLRGWDFYEKLRANNIMIVNGTDQVYDMVKRGERPIAAGGDQSNSLTAIKQGLPIENVIPSDGTFVIPAPTAVIKGAPHPEAAKLLAEFLISKEGQNILSEYSNYPSRDDVAPPAGGIPQKQIKLLEISYDYVASSSKEIKQKFNEIFLQ